MEKKNIFEYDIVNAAALTAAHAAAAAQSAAHAATSTDQETAAAHATAAEEEARMAYETAMEVFKMAREVRAAAAKRDRDLSAEEYAALAALATRCVEVYA